MPVHISLSQKFAIAKKLEEVILKNVDNTAHYLPTWNDERVAIAIGAPVNALHVRNVRREIFGNLRHNKPASPGSHNLSGAVYNRLRWLESDLEAVMNYLAAKHPNWRQGDDV